MLVAPRPRIAKAPESTLPLLRSFGFVAAEFYKYAAPSGARTFIWIRSCYLRHKRIWHRAVGCDSEWLDEDAGG